MSFSNPAAFAAVRDAKNGDLFNVTTVKNEKSGYWDWTSATKAEGADVSATVKATSAPSSTRSSYETTEERALRQRLIVRQSSLSNAVEILQAAHARGEVTIKEVTSLADEFAEWVYKATVEQQELGDIPF